MKKRLVVFIFVIFSLVNKNESVDKSSTRLIGAELATAGEFPWLVSLQRAKENGDFKHFCAGSIVDQTHIVTAAHCVWNKLNTTITVLAGVLNISANETGQQRTTVFKIYTHPKYTSENKAGPYDIAVLEIETALKFNKLVGAIDLPDPKEPASGDCKFAGWGNRFLITGIYYHASDVLRTVSSTIITRFMCFARYLFLFRRQLDTAICTAAGPLKGSCQGDSGGSLVCFNKQREPYLAGVTSWGWVICGDGIHPDVSTDVSLFIDFIRGFMKTSNKKKKSKI